jgi:hypothetical protein
MNYFAAETAPLLRYAKQNGGSDLSNNCVVDYADVEIMASQWLDPYTSGLWPKPTYFNFF